MKILAMICSFIQEITTEKLLYATNWEYSMTNIQIQLKASHGPRRWGASEDITSK